MCEVIQVNIQKLINGLKENLELNNGSLINQFQVSNTYYLVGKLSSGYILYYFNTDLDICNEDIQDLNICNIDVANSLSILANQHLKDRSTKAFYTKQCAIVTDNSPDELNQKQLIDVVLEIMSSEIVIASECKKRLLKNQSIDRNKSHELANPTFLMDKSLEPSFNDIKNSIYFKDENELFDYINSNKEELILDIYPCFKSEFNYKKVVIAGFTIKYEKEMPNDWFYIMPTEVLVDTNKRYVDVAELFTDLDIGYFYYTHKGVFAHNFPFELTIAFQMKHKF